MNPLDMLPRFLGAYCFPTLGNRHVYVERWIPGSRATARLQAMLAKGLPAKLQNAAVNFDHGRLDLVELRVEPMPGLGSIPQVSGEDIGPPVVDRQERARNARMGASVDAS